MEKQVRNESMVLRWAVSLALGVALSLPAMAQDVQTASGAQQFLAAMSGKVLTRVHFKDAAGRFNYVTGKYTGGVTTTKGGLRKQKTTVEPLPEKTVEKQLAEVRASVLEAIDAWGRPSACTTRLTEVAAAPYDEVKTDTGTDTRSFSWTVTTTNESWKYEPLTKFMNPAQVIEWTSAQVTRNPDGSVTVASKGQTFPTIYLTYVAGDADLADRIEFAMKVLAMSCNENAVKAF
jgi:hypothetical protein